MDAAKPKPLEVPAVKVVLIRQDGGQIKQVEITLCLQIGPTHA